MTYDDTMRKSCELLFRAFDNISNVQPYLRDAANTNSDFIKEMINESRRTGSERYLQDAERIRGFAVDVARTTNTVTHLIYRMADIINSDCNGYLRILLSD